MSSGRILAKEGHCWKLIFISSGMHRIIFAESFSFLYLIDCVIARLCFYLFLCIVGFAGFQGGRLSLVQKRIESFLWRGFLSCI